MFSLSEQLSAGDISSSLLLQFFEVCVHRYSESTYDSANGINALIISWHQFVQSQVKHAGGIRMGFREHATF